VDPDLKTYGIFAHLSFLAIKIYAKKYVENRQCSIFGTSDIRTTVPEAVII